MIDESFDRGDTIVLRSTVTYPENPDDPDSGRLPLDLTGAGVELRFTAKLRARDAQADALFEKTYIAGGAAEGIALDPAVDDDNVALITIDPEDTDELERTTMLAVDLELSQVDVVTTVDRGRLKVRVDTSS